ETDLDIEEGPIASADLYQTDKDANQWLVILTFHHMVIDEYSSNTFWSELIDLYQAKDPTAMVTPTKRLDYSQYATIYQAILESRGTSDGQWWRDAFRGYRPQPLFQDAIGNLNERLSGYDVAADIYWKILPQKEATRLTARRENAANTFGAWLSLAQLFLSRVTGKTEYLLGVPTSTRPVDPRFVSVMGYCMTLAVLPVSLDLDQESLVFEAATLEKYRQCVAHDQRVEDILSWLAEENQTENTTNVDALFVYHDPSDSSLELGNSGLHYKKLADATGGSHYHLILHLDNSGPSIRVGFEYRTESFSAKFIEALAQAFTELVVELSCCDERSVREIVSTAPSQALPFAMEASTRQAGPVLQELRRRGENLNILDHIYMTASANQGAIAIATAERNVTYRQLLEWVSGVASKLRREGVKTGDVVVLFMDKSVEYLASVLALIHVGACFVPFDITSTLAVNNSKLAVLAPTLILTRRHVNGAVYEDEKYYRKLDASSIRRIAISTPPQVDQPHHNLHKAETSTTELSADAYIAFTSGSTAEPKCFRISHRALVSSICSQVEALNISTGHRVAMLTSLAFDVSLMEMFCTFVAGSTLVVAPHDQFITSLADTLRNMAVTHAIATPTMITAIDSPSEVPSLKSIILGGEPIPSVLYERWWGAVDIRISYGPAETTIATHDFIVKTKPTSNSCNIGRPSPSVRAFVLDAQYNPVLPGIPGRLFIGAAEEGKYDQLTSGYISPLSANKRLVNHSSLGRLYDTGDIVRYDLQGTFTLIGRTDDQVKISGVRFNIGDVEKTIDVFVGARRRCAVVISETQPGNKALTCFIEFSDTDSSITIPLERHATITSNILLLNDARCEELAALRDRVSEALPAAMIPKYWIPVKELPVSRTGKIDRRRLNEGLASAHCHGTKIEEYSTLVAQISHLHEARDDEEVVKSSQSPDSGPVSSYREGLKDELMQSLIIAWTEILPIDETQVDIHRSFFKTGGDSVSAIRFCARARKLGIRSCTVAKMRSNPSLSQLHDVLAYDNSSLLSNMPSSDDEPTDEASGLTPPSSMPSTPTSSGYSFVKLPGATDFTALSISGQSTSTTGVDDEEFTGIFRHVESFMNTSELAQQIAAAGLNESEVDVVYPPTAMQSSMVQQSLLDSNSGVYHSQLILHLEGSLQETKLRKAWSAVCNANPSLRTIFVPLERGHVPGVAYLAVELKQKREREHVMERPSHKRIEAALQTAILSSDFQACAEAFGVTPFTIVQLAFALALEGSWIDHKSPTRVGFWTVTGGRSHMVDDINAIGNFLNTIPCVVALSSTTSVHKCLQTTYRMFTTMSEHDCVSTPDILRCFEKPECDIDALLVFENHPDASEPQLHFGSNIRLNSVDGREVSSLPFVVVVEPGQAEVKILAKFDEARHHSGSLDDLTDRLAIYLSRQDNSNSKIVPIVLEKSPWMVIAMLAVLKSGRAYCPLEFDAPSHRISFAIKRLGAGLIITNENGFPKLASLSTWGHPQILVIDNIQTLLANAETRTSRDAVSLLPTLHPDMACYVMFTSGSTSSPKACTLTHGAVASAVQAVQRLYNFEPSSRILLFANYVFDASAIDIWGSLSSGSCLFLLHDDELKSDLVGHVDRLQINWVHLTPTVLRTISPDQVPSLKTIIVGGEMMVPDLLNTWAKQVEIVAAYGPTEAAIQVLTFRPSRYPIDEITYTALPGNLVMVVNERREICHVNEPGEIVIAGKQLFVGYEGNGFATQAALTMIHGFGDFKFYKTGDRAYYSHIGEDEKPRIRILGRIDHQMKVSGMRIAPEEIEEVLNADPDVLCSAVVAGYGRSLDALVVGRDTNLNMSRLMTLCRERLPERLRPVIHQVKEIPLLASRKVDRKGLSALLNNIIASKPGDHHSSNVSQNDSAKISAVSAIIENVLGTKVIDVNAPLANLGLDSLGFMRLKHLLCTKFHLPDLTYRQLRNIATAAGIADLVGMDSPLAASSDHDAAYWQIFSPSESIGYRVWRFEDVTADSLLSGLLDVVHGLEMFRTTFEFDLSVGKLYQVVRDETLVAVQISWISHIDMDDLRARFIPHNCATIDLRNGPLAIFHLIADGRTVFLHSTIHHIIVDEVTSIQLFNLIRRASRGNSDPCAFEGTSSITLHAAQIASRHDENHLNEWKQRMSGAIGIDTESHYEGSYDQLSRLGSEDSLEDFTKQIREGVDFALESDMAINKVASACGLDTANFMIQFIMHDAQSYDDMSSDMTDMTLDLITSEKPMFDLMWHVFAHKDCLDVLVEFNERKYDKDDIKILVQAWEKVVDKHDCQGGQSISSILSTIIPEDSLLKKNVSNTKLAKQACELQFPPPSDLSSSVKHRATSMPIDISGGLNQRAIELQSLVTDSLCRALGVTVIDLDQNLREIGLDSFTAMSFIASILRVEPELEISLRDITACPSIRLLVDTLAQKDGRQSKYDKARARFESLIRESLCKSLGIASIDGQSNLRELGLDSFSCMAFMADMIRHEPDISVSMRDVMSCPTMENLVEHFADRALSETCDNKSDDGSYVALGREMLQRPQQGLASSMQKRFYLLQEQLGDSTYSLPSAYRVHGVHLSHIIAALQDIVTEHDIFRTHFDFTDESELLQIVDGSERLEYTIHDLSTYSDETAGEEVTRISHEECMREFNLAEGHLVRCTAIILPNGEQYIIINFHHCIADEQTITSIWEELCSVVADKSCSKETANVDVGSYIDFSTRHHEMLKSNKLAEAQTFFQNLLVGPENLHGLFLRPGSESESYPDAVTINRGAIFDYDPVQWAYKSGSTPFAAYLFTFQLLLTFKSGTEGSLVLIPATCRGPREQNLYGCFINTLPVRFTKLAGTCSIADTLQGFQDCLAKILEYSDIPFERLLDSIGWGANDFDTLFTYHNVPAGAREKLRTIEPCKGILPGVLPGISAKFPLAFTMTREMIKNGKSKLDMSVEFNPDRISEAEVLEICKEYECLLRHIQRHGPYASLDDIEGTYTDLKTFNHPRVATDGTTSESESNKDTNVTQRDSHSELQVVSNVPSWFHGMPNPIVETTPFADVQILDQARTRPSATAMIFEDEVSITYKEMANMISGLASYLSTRIDPQNMLNQAICIVGDASIERIITILAIMTAGGAYVPIELNNPIDWNLTIIADCEPAAVVFIPEKEPLRVEQASQLRVQLNAKGILCVDIITPLPMTSAPFNLTTKRLPEHLAYVLYTSGSTGKPKGVAIQNHALRNATVSLRPLYRLAPNKRLLQLAPWTFDVSVIDIFGTLTVGATLCIGRKSWMLADLQDTMAMLRITHIATTPTIAGALDANALPDVECLDIGGEPMTELCRDVWASKATLFNIYGPTEATVDVLGRQCFPDTDISNIGRPLENVFVYVLDDKLEQVGIGEEGQLAIGGHQLARGYLKPPPGAAAFVDTKDYGRIYLTGDCARFESDGSIVCLGRMDTMVNLRGLRVELGAIESAVNNALDQGKSVVIMIKRPSGDCLVAIFTDASLQTKGSLKPLSLAGLGPLLLKLQASVKAKLPAYFMPSLWVPVNDIPMNNNGKLDRKMIKSLIGELSEEALDGYLPQAATDEKLDQIDRTAPVVDLSPELPSSLLFQQSRINESELLRDNMVGVQTQDITMQAPRKSERDTCDQIGMAVRAAFHTVLGTKSLENNSNFFSMGGDSISVIKLRSAFTKAGLKCKVKDIYQNPTIGALTLFFGGTISHESPNGIDATGRSASNSAAGQVSTELPLITTPVPTAETRIQSAFKEILGDRQFPRDASFFSMGGDSISVIRLRSVLTKAGFMLKVKDIYQNPTIIALADFLDPTRSTGNDADNVNVLQSSVQPMLKTESQMVSSLVPPTPIIDWFFASQRANEDWFNQGHIIKLNKKHTYEDFQRAWSNIVEVHPMLRLVVSKSVTHEHGKFIGIPNENTDHTYFLRRRLSTMEELPEEFLNLQSCLNLSSGRICAVGGFHIGDELYCAIFAHHLAVDVVSWQVIWSDLEDLLQGGSIEPEFSSFPEWAEYLSRKRQIAGQIPARIFAREYSSFLTMEQMKRLPENKEASGNFMNVKVDVSSLNLRREDTEPVDMMLAGLVLALNTWQRLRPPTNRVELHFESHGRDLELKEFDLTRTVGWFTRIIPIAFNVPLQGSLNDFTAMVQQTRKHAMSSVNLASAIETAPVDGMITFNYLGQRARTSSYTSFENVEMDLGMYQSPTNQRFSILDIECSLTHEGQLDIGVFYSTSIHTADEIRQLLDSWSYCIRSMAGESQLDIARMQRIAVGRDTSGPPAESPVDHSTYSIPECMQDQRDAIEESIVAWKLNIQDIEKMAPATDGQAAMLLASLGSRSYMHSYNYEASDTDTDIQLLQHAWDVVLGRHSIFRTVLMPLSPWATHNEKSHQSDIQLVQIILKASALPTPLVQIGKRLKPMQPGFAKQLCRLHIHKSPTTQKAICTWTCHHALIDGFSMRLVLAEVRSVYIGQALAPQITQFSDIVVSRYEKGRQDTRSNDFWQSQMRDIEPSLLVNPLRANQVQTETQKAIHETLIDRHQQFCFPVSPKHFKDAAHYNHTTIPVLFHAAWALTLSTYLSTRDVVFGSVVSGRRGEDTERIQNVVGPCLNTVPLRVCVDWDQNMRQFIEHVTDAFLDMAEHEDLLSLKQIQGLSRKKTLFNSTLITNTPLKSENMVQSGFHLTLKDMDEVTDVPLLLNMSCEDRTIHVADARRDTIQPLQSMDLLESNHHRMVDDLVSGPLFPVEYDGLTCSQLLQRRVSRSPDQSAVELYRKKGQKPVVMTYKTLSTIVELGAKRLRAEVKLVPKSRVAIFLDKSTELICAIHAIHRADCAYVALDIDNPQARTELLLEQICPSAIICSKDTLKLLSQTFLEDGKCPFIIAEQLFSPATQSSNDRHHLPPSTATSDDIAAILFTSGTTGTPKAVIMPHRQVVGYGVMMAEAIGYGRDDRVFNFARLVFDVSQSDIFGAIYSGATLILAPQSETVARLPALLGESGTTSLNTTPSIASLLYPDSLPQIRSLCLAGDLGAYDSNGEIVYHARKDRQIKTLAILEAQAHKMLPSFMIPKCFIPISAIPLTGNSKVDQLKLHEIYKQWKTQRSNLVHDPTAMTLRPTAQAPEKSTYEQQVLPQQHGLSPDIDWALREDDWSDYLLPYFNPKTPLDTHSRRQIFAFFAITGTSKQHSVLASYLPSFNLIGVENIFFHQPDHYNSLQAMAVEHCALLRRQQPTGPYLLAGFSFAGQLAYEVANELRQLGEDDVRVVLIDSAARERAPTRPGGVTDAECEKFFKVPTTLEAMAAGPEVIEYRRYLIDQIRHNISLHNEYVPRPFDGDALIIPRLPNQGEVWDGDETNGYGEFVPHARLQVRTVTAADHFAVMEEEQALRKVGQFIEEFMTAF
ncbi:hypothetical protein J3F84DRAFT_404381, partial [Trichoderma pleuroticola]